MATADYTITKEELLAELDRLAQEKLGISAEEFMERYNAGLLDDGSPTVSHLAVFARLLKQYR